MTVQPASLQELPRDLDSLLLPKHVAVIMNGNGLWAEERSKPRTTGHQQGVETLKSLLYCCRDWGISALTAYTFSTENWNKPSEEVNSLMALFERVLRQELRELVTENVRLSFVGDLDKLPQSLQTEITKAIQATVTNTGIQFTIAANYGGRAEIVRAFRAIASQVQQGALNAAEITEKLFEQHLYTKDLEHPDLLIRTSGEMKLSNFLLWQMAYAEIYVTDTLWPDFDRKEFHRALLSYQKRDRRFGKVKTK